MKIEIKNRFSHEVLFSHECEDNSVAITLAAAINAKTALEGSDLRGSDLEGSDLRGSDLRNVDLEGANLEGSDLRNADLEGANLRGANLRGANLRNADLEGSDLRNADLRNANLRNANLRGANLRNADLEGANLEGADLRCANLRGVDLGGAGKLTGDRPYFEVGPIGSQQDILAAFLTEKGVFLRAGCFFGTAEAFRDKLQGKHGDNFHAVEYRAALVLVEAHYAAWPATVVEEEF